MSNVIRQLNFSEVAFMEYSPWKYSVSYENYPHWILKNAQEGSIFADKVCSLFLRLPNELGRHSNPVWERVCLFSDC